MPSFIKPGSECTAKKKPVVVHSAGYKCLGIVKKVKRLLFIDKFLCGKSGPAAIRNRLGVTHE